MSCHVNKPVDGLRLPSARFFKMPSIFSLLPFIFQLPPTKNFLSIVKCWGKVQLLHAQTVQLDRRTWNVRNVWLKSSLLNWSAGHDLSTGSDCTPAVNSAGCGTRQQTRQRHLNTSSTGDQNVIGALQRQRARCIDTFWIISGAIIYGSWLYKGLYINYT